MNLTYDTFGCNVDHTGFVWVHAKPNADGQSQLFDFIHSMEQYLQQVFKVCRFCVCEHVYARGCACLFVCSLVWVHTKPNADNRSCFISYIQWSNICSRCVVFFFVSVSLRSCAHECACFFFCLFVRVGCFVLLHCFFSLLTFRQISGWLPY